MRLNPILHLAEFTWLSPAGWVYIWLSNSAYVGSDTHIALPASAGRADARRIVVHDDMHVQSCGHVFVDLSLREETYAGYDEAGLCCIKCVSAAPGHVAEE